MKTTRVATKRSNSQVRQRKQRREDAALKFLKELARWNLPGECISCGSTQDNPECADHRHYEPGWTLETNRMCYAIWKARDITGYKP